MSSSLPIPAVVSTIRPLTADTMLLTVCTEAGNPVGSSFLPGQFLELSIPGAGEIPISYCGSPTADGSIELCVRQVGHVTNALKTAIPGDGLGVRGPFGRGFPLPAYIDRHLLLMAGGLGMAPLRSLLLALLKQSAYTGRITLLYAAREAGLLLFLDELLELQQRGSIELHLGVDYPDDCGEVPSHCRVALLPALLDQLETVPEKTCAAICGPPAVYPLLASALKSLGLAADHIHFSLERRMKCGIGRCGHCAVGTRLCCIDGPVFSYGELSEMDGDRS